MPNASIGGLVSGLDTASIISQLMQVEATPQTLLKNKVSTEKTSLSSLQALNAKLLTVATKANDLAKVANWAPFTATSSSDKVTATVTSGATASSISFEVRQTATARQLTFAPMALNTRVTPADSTAVQLTNPDGEVFQLETGDGSLDGLVKAINAAGAGVRATTLQLADGTSRVIVRSEKTGADVTFGLTGLDPAHVPTETAGKNAQIMVGTDLLESATNTFTGTVSGLDITLSASATAGTVVDITVTRDSAAMTDSVQALVDAANAVLTDIASLTAYKTSTSAGGALAGDSTLRSLREELLSSITGGLDGRSLADVGVELDRYGKITFDAGEFKAAYTADPAGTADRFAATASWTDDPADANTGSAALAGFTWRTAAGPHSVDSVQATLGGEPATVSGTLLTGKAGTAVDGLAVSVTGTAVGTLTYAPGFAARLAAIAERASDSTVGTVTAAITGRTTAIDSLEDAIAGWDVRLTKRRESLERQYAALEVALGQLQNQSSWLAGQIAGLPSYSSGS
ncbi:MAG: flagellar filament capping protein FliD [Actinomycetota bacterium]|nr:flagellar filament capping protein FliD [Actinomycetota bacterium]